MTIKACEVVGPGNPYPFGVTDVNHVTDVNSANKCSKQNTTQNKNVAIYAPDCKQVFIHFFLPDTEELVAKVELVNRTGKVFHGKLSAVSSQWFYAIQGIQNDPRKGHDIDKNLLIDPYAKSLNRELVWQASLYNEQNPSFIPKAAVSIAKFDWQDLPKPNISLAQTILYEMHVKGFTQQFPNLTAQERGKYLGLANEHVIHHIKSLGVTSVQLMPVFSFMSEPRLQELGLSNYWGYNPINWFSPDPRYGHNDAVNELKTAIRELHRNNIEVILDVVFNHTAEGDKSGPTFSFKGFAEAEFYLADSDGFDTGSGHSFTNSYANYTGCGNTVNADSDYALQMIMDALRYWLTEMQVDGFRFDLAASLGRNGARFNRHSALFRAINQDPIISNAKLIAEPWDIGPEGYQLGNFPPTWVECNDKYRDSIRKFWRGDKGLVPEVASRILGSRDIFKKGRRSQVSSVNYITYHDGFTLDDLVSYEQRHNLANLEDNRDGHGSNFSSNYGVEGPTTDRAIIELRQRQKRNMLATLLFSQGIPHLLAGDEIGRSQNGNNNAYCQDNELSWLDWQLDSSAQSFLEFVQQLISLRKQYPVLQKCFLADDDYEHSEYHHHVNWIRQDGEPKQVDDWQNQENQCLGLVIADDDKNQHMLLLLNASGDPQKYTLPSAIERSLLLDTNLYEINSIDKETNNAEYYTQAPQSMSLWRLRS